MDKEEELFQVWINDDFNYEIYQRVSARATHLTPVQIFNLIEEIASKLVFVVLFFVDKPSKVVSWIRGCVPYYADIFEEADSKEFVINLVIKIAEERFKDQENYFSNRNRFDFIKTELLKMNSINDTSVTPEELYNWVSFFSEEEDVAVGDKMIGTELRAMGYLKSYEQTVKDEYESARLKYDDLRENRKKVGFSSTTQNQQAYDRFEDLFYDRDTIDPCVQVLRELNIKERAGNYKDHSVLGEGLRYISGFKYIFGLWYEELLKIDPPVVHNVNRDLRAKLMCDYFEGLSVTGKQLEYEPQYSDRLSGIIREKLKEKLSKVSNGKHGKS